MENNKKVYNKLRVYKIQDEKNYSSLKIIIPIALILIFFMMMTSAMKYNSVPEIEPNCRVLEFNQVQIFTKNADVKSQELTIIHEDEVHSIMPLIHGQGVWINYAWNEYSQVVVSIQEDYGMILCEEKQVEESPLIKILKMKEKYKE